MKRFTRIANLTLALALLALMTTGAMALEGWGTDFEKAQKEAKEEKKPILVNFSGSDWCGWCIKLDKEVLSKETFQDYAEENLVLFVADFPQKTEQPEDLKKQNERLLKRYQVRGFPTLLLLSPEGELLAQTGYRPGGPKAYVEHLKQLLSETKYGGKD